MHAKLMSRNSALWIRLCTVLLPFGTSGRELVYAAHMPDYGVKLQPLS